MEDFRKDNIQYIKGVGPKKASLLTKLGVFTIGDLLEHYPRRYEDRSQLKMINNLTDGQVENFKAKMMNYAESKPRRGLQITKITVGDSTGTVQLVWFNQPHRKKIYRLGAEILVTGKVKKIYQVEIQNPEIEMITDMDTLEVGYITPVYAANESITQRFLRSLIRQILTEYNTTAEILPSIIINQFSLLDRKTAFENIHFPMNMDVLKKARRRLVFEELYLLQCGLLYIKKQNRSNTVGIKHGPEGRLLKHAKERLPFNLTEDQQKVLLEITFDMEDVKPMQRLLQGDVGSGKTVIAALALAKTVENGYQGAMMVPTEILAEQHYTTLSELFLPLGIRVKLLTGKLSKRIHEEVIVEIKSGLVDIVIGTHALIQDSVEFQYLGLVITDEQHRFGVRQRAKLQEKGNMPDVLVMTATPIPRTMALTVYGDLDVSTIKQLPPGRKKIKTYVRGSDRRQLVYDFIAKEISSGRQAYVVCPLVEESEKINAQSAVELYDQLLESELENISCGLVHGKMKSREKDLVMDRFYRGEIKVLVATTVIEVGVNVPNATIMIIENAERFGLAQLHQLRGRIGRGRHQSYCILLSDNKKTETQERLSIMAKTNDGFVLAEEDLKIRGPGQFFGIRQHGLPDLKIADIMNDIDVFFEARQAAEKTVSRPESFNILRPALQARFGKEFSMIFSS
ncbi:ATP-dependent DNA helicase RecG [Pelosinus propionicus]|uniref:ATP-dependent DNA helicase RecG n=1 Tax=Pelosinus propionicus DSM 13327 TaxID=1123291 RepID=A0A1I4HCL0_9FIRM|nr:ATP-dependent DNA helicase RecG [Pelosinus propionicus]SFL40039.1 ATP-dependent DNA helicase RecG [Pelosinus propionicus DSM 13327]